ncbi:MAG: trimethylamine methyltransferase family protein, partial [Halofilum sp. (in: g-proteobacteria)]
MARTRGGRAARRRARADDEGGASVLQQLEWQPLRYSDAPTEPLNQEGVEAIHDAAMRILEEVGIDFLHEDARRLLAQAGCTIDGDGPTVRMGREFVMEQLAKAPESFTITPRNPARAVPLAPGQGIFGSVASAPNVADLENGRRTGTRADFQTLLKLAQSFNCVHLHCGYPVEPVDIHASIRHLDAIHDLLTLTDKAVHAYALGRERIDDAMEMVRIAGGLDEETFEASPH